LEIGFGIQKLKDENVNKKAFIENKFYIHFQNIPSINPEDYDRSGKSALNTVQAFCDNGALLAVDYSTIDISHIYIGKISPDSEIGLEEISGYWYKYVQLHDVKKISYSKYPLLNAVKPIKQTVCRWRSLENILEDLYEGKSLPMEVSSLLPQHLEILCSEYLQMFKIIHVPTLKIGGSQSKIDISGIGLQGRRIFVQVSNKINKHKIDNLKAFKSEDSLLIYFGPELELKNWLNDCDIEFITIEKVFETLTQYSYSSYYLMIKEMLLMKK